MPYPQHTCNEFPFLFSLLSFRAFQRCKIGLSAAIFGFSIFDQYFGIGEARRHLAFIYSDACTLGGLLLLKAFITTRRPRFYWIMSLKNERSFQDTHNE